MKYLLVVSCLALTGCPATTPWQPAPGQDIQIRVDQRLLESCPPLPTNVVIKTGEDALAAQAIGAKMYVACSERHEELSNIVRNYILTVPTAASSASGAASAPEISR